MRPIRIFISSVQSEFASERARLCDYLRQDPMLCWYFKPYIFEAQPATDMEVRAVYLREAAEADIYIGLLGAKYGYEDEEGVSPTEREYDTATKHKRHRLIFVKKCTTARHPKEELFLKKVEKAVVWESFSDFDELKAGVYSALVHYMQNHNILRQRPFDATVNEHATLNDIDRNAVRTFVRNAKGRRSLPFNERTETKKILTHLELMTESGKLTNAALLLFAKNPQHFIPASELKCAQFYGTEIVKPIPFYQVFQGNVFDLVDQAVAFVMSHIDARVGTREKKTAVDVDYELPLFAVREAIVNAVTHRDYTSNGSVQVMLFRDRLEVWSPGRLPSELSIDRLSKPHHSVPVNHLLANPIYLAGYIERMGTGTSEIVRSCLKLGLHKPQFEQQESFRVVIWRKNGIPAETVEPPHLAASEISPRQKLILSKLLSNPTYTTEKLANDMKLKPRTIARDLDYLKNAGFLERMGNTRWGAWLVLKHPVDDTEMS